MLICGRPAGYGCGEPASASSSACRTKRAGSGTASQPPSCSSSPGKRRHAARRRRLQTGTTSLPAQVWGEQRSGLNPNNLPGPPGRSKWCNQSTQPPQRLDMRSSSSQVEAEESDRICNHGYEHAVSPSEVLCTSHEEAEQLHQSGGNLPASDSSRAKKTCAEQKQAAWFRCNRPSAGERSILSGQPLSRKIKRARRGV